MVDFNAMSHLKVFEHLKIQLAAIKSATNNFADERCIGVGGFGKVYRGNISFFGGHVMVALKRLNNTSEQGDLEFWKEIMMLSLYKHKNVVPLVGFCDDHGEKILVYEYVPNRSLDFHLKSDKLTWLVRLKICIGAAQGLAYLHSAVGSQQRVLHRDIKSSNILLDEDMNAKISDFGLSKYGPANQEYTFLFSNNVVGTFGYCDPLYAENGFLTKESDVYSFGVVLFEVLCGRLWIDYYRARQSLVELAQKSYEQNTINEIVFGKIKDEINPKSLQFFAKIAYQCLKSNREERPLMTDIVRQLVIALGYQELKDIQVTSSYLLSEPSEVMESDRRKYAQPLVSKEYDSDGGGLLVVTIHQGYYPSKRKTFVLLRIGYAERRTTKIKNQNPQWKETFTFTLEKPAKEILHLALFADPPWYRDFNLKENLGDVHISVAEVVKERHTTNTYAFGNFKILVELQWKPSAS